jgi:membrane protease YdiL (CAAX protease family)
LNLKPFSKQYRIVLVGAALEIGLAGVAWLLGWLTRRPTVQYLHWSFHDLLLGAATSVPLLLAFLLLLHQNWGPCLRIRRVLDEVVKPLLLSCTTLELALLSFAAGFGEELLFRAYIQDLLSDWCGQWVGLALASCLFGLLHPVTPAYCLLATIFGLYLGWCWSVTGNLLVVIIAHGLYDFAALYYLLRSREQVKNSMMA